MHAFSQRRYSLGEIRVDSRKESPSLISQARIYCVILSHWLVYTNMDGRNGSLRSWPLCDSLMVQADHCLGAQMDKTAAGLHWH